MDGRNTHELASRDIVPGLLVLAAGISCDDSAVVGYPPERKVNNLGLCIGPRARLRGGTVIYAGSRIGADFQTGHHVVVREQNVIGDDVRVWNNTTIDYGCCIGHRVKIHANCYIAQYSIIEDDVFLAPGITVANDLHPGCAYSKDCMRGPTIETGAQVGANVTILPMVTIGKRAVIGAGAVVTRDIPADCLVIGNPGRVVKPVQDIHCTTGIAPGGYGYHPYGGEGDSVR